MKLLAKADILENQKKHKAGDTFETDEATGLLLLEMGWAEEVKEKPKKKK
jgi:hypothetical protein